MPFYPKSAMLQIGQKKGVNVKPKADLTAAVMEDTSVLTAGAEIRKISKVRNLKILNAEYADIFAAQINALKEQAATATTFDAKQKALALQHALEQAQAGLHFLSDESLFGVVTTLSKVSFMSLFSGEGREAVLDNTINSLMQPLAETISGFIADVTTPETASGAINAERNQAKAEIASAMADLMRFALCKSRPDLMLKLVDDRELDAFILEPGNLEVILKSVEDSKSTWSVSLKAEDYELYQRNRAWDWFYENSSEGSIEEIETRMQAKWARIQFATDQGEQRQRVIAFPPRAAAAPEPTKKLSKQEQEALKQQQEKKQQEEEFIAIIKKDAYGQQLYINSQRLVGGESSTEGATKKQTEKQAHAKARESAHYKATGLTEKEKQQLDKAMQKPIEKFAEKRFYAAAASLYAEKRAKATLAKLDAALERIGVRPAQREFLKLLLKNMLENPKQVDWLKGAPVELITLIPQILQMFGGEENQQQFGNVAAVIAGVLQKLLPDANGNVALLSEDTNKWLAQVLDFENLQAIGAVTTINAIRDPESDQHKAAQQTLNKIDNALDAFIQPLHERDVEAVDDVVASQIPAAPPTEPRARPASKPLTVSKKALIGTIITLTRDNPPLFDGAVMGEGIETIDSQQTAIAANPLLNTPKTRGYEKAGATIALLEANKQLLVELQRLHFRDIYSYLTTIIGETWDQKEWETLLMHSGRGKYLKNLCTDAVIDIIASKALAAVTAFMVDFAAAGAGTATSLAERNAAKDQINAALQDYLTMLAKKQKVDVEEFFNDRLLEPLINVSANPQIIVSIKNGLFELLKQQNNKKSDKNYKIDPVSLMKILMNPMLQTVGDQENQILLGHFATVLQSLEDALYMANTQIPGLSAELNTVLTELSEREHAASSASAQAEQSAEGQEQTQLIQPVQHPTKVAAMVAGAQGVKKKIEAGHAKLHAFKAHQIIGALKDEVTILGEHQPLPPSVFANLCLNWQRKFKDDVVNVNANKSGGIMRKKELSPRDVESINKFLTTKYESSELFLIDLFALKNELDGVPAAHQWFKDVLAQYRGAVEAQKLLTPSVSPRASGQHIAANKALLQQLILRLDMIATADDKLAATANEIREKISIEDMALELENKKMWEPLEKIIVEIDNAYKSSGTKNMAEILSKVDTAVQALGDYPVEDLIKKQILAGREIVEKSSFSHRTAMQKQSNTIAEYSTEILTQIEELKIYPGHHAMLEEYHQQLSEAAKKGPNEREAALYHALNNIRGDLIEVLEYARHTVDVDLHKAPRLGAGSISNVANTSAANSITTSPVSSSTASGAISSPDNTDKGGIKRKH